MGLGHFYFQAFYLVKYKNNSGYHTAFHTIGCTKSFIYHALTPHNDAVEWSFFPKKRLLTLYINILLTTFDNLLKQISHSVFIVYFLTIGIIYL